MDLPGALTAAAPGVRARSYEIPAAEKEASISNPNDRVQDQVVSRDAQTEVSDRSGQVSDANAEASSSASQASTGSGRDRILTIEEQYVLQLRSLFESKKSYPVMARKLGKEGRVTLQLVLDANGNVLQHQVAESSGSDLLDQAGLKLVEQIGKFPPFPEEIQRTNWQFFIPIEYRL